LTHRTDAEKPPEMG